MDKVKAILGAIFLVYMVFEGTSLFFDDFRKSFDHQTIVLNKERNDIVCEMANGTSINWANLFAEKTQVDRKIESLIAEREEFVREHPLRGLFIKDFHHFMSGC